MNYEDLLDKAYKEVRVSEGNSGDRFKIPSLHIEIIGSKTIISNFHAICKEIRRSEEVVSKFLSKELAAKVALEKDRLILNRKIPEKQVQDKFKYYVDHYVLCKICKKPDTALSRNDGVLLMNCLACGAKNPLGRV